MSNKKQQFLNKVGLLIKAKRNVLGLSQEEAAWQCGISKNALCSIELAKGDVKLSNIMSIFEVLGIDFCELNNIHNMP